MYRTNERSARTRTRYGIIIKLNFKDDRPLNAECLRACVRVFLRQVQQTF